MLKNNQIVNLHGIQLIIVLDQTIVGVYIVVKMINYYQKCYHQQVILKYGQNLEIMNKIHIKKLFGQLQFKN